MTYKTLEINKKNCILTCLAGDWYLKRPLFAPLLITALFSFRSSVTDFTSSMAVPNSSFFSKHEYAKLSRADSPISRCFLFACGEFSFDFVIDAKFVCQLLFALHRKEERKEM